MPDSKSNLYLFEAILLRSEYDRHIKLLEKTIGEVKDKDNHILRTKVSKANCDGDAKLFSLIGSFEIYNPLFLTLQFDYISVDTEGKEKQYDEGEWLGTIDQKNFSKRRSVEFAVGYAF